MNSLDSVRRSRRAQLVDFWSVSANFTFFAKLFYLEICMKMDENGRFQTIGNSKSLQISDILDSVVRKFPSIFENAMRVARC